MYLFRPPRWLTLFFRDCIWKMPEEGNRVYLTFDDGPHPEITMRVLDLLAQYGAKASFFCIGDNVARYPDIYRRILDEGHTVGNHTFHHLNAWKVSDEAWMADIRKAADLIDSPWFRPPYGRIRNRQARALREMGLKTVMWSVLSGDFDTSLSKEECARITLGMVKPGSILVFHDSEKARERMEFALPLVLERIKARGWVADRL